jgi:hypothetical protein
VETIDRNGLLNSIIITYLILTLKPASEHAHTYLLPRLSWSWTVLLPSDTHRKPITSTTAVLLPCVTNLLTLTHILAISSDTWCCEVVWFFNADEKPQLEQSLHYKSLSLSTSATCLLFVYMHSLDILNEEIQQFTHRNNKCMFPHQGILFLFLIFIRQEWGWIYERWRGGWAINWFHCYRLLNFKSNCEITLLNTVLVCPSWEGNSCSAT